jgi:hypothetical protein
MTSLPIMWFAAFDFQYEKDRPEEEKQVSIYLPSDDLLFMRNPFLYKIGIEKRCFGNK